MHSTHDQSIIGQKYQTINSLSQHKVIVTQYESSSLTYAIPWLEQSPSGFTITELLCILPYCSVCSRILSIIRIDCTGYLPFADSPR